MNLIYILNDYLRKIEIDYAICGGCAIDLFIGKKTRPHKDLDVAVYWEHRDKIVKYMLEDGWNLFEPCGNQYLHKINNIKDQKCAKSNIWCVKHNNSRYKFVEHEKDIFAANFDGTDQLNEYLFNSRDNANLIYARNHTQCNINLFFSI